MPELPEVETTVKILKKACLGRAFIDVWTDASKLVKKPESFLDFKEQLKGKRIKEVTRAGKNIIFSLSGECFLLAHQKMTGHLLYGKWKLFEGKWQSQIQGPLKDDPMNRFLHLIFFLDNGFQIALCDVRKFAKVEFLSKAELKKEIEQLGQDGLKISLAGFKDVLSKKRGNIKTALMDQKALAGVGNIYSDEILFEAKIHPLMKANKLSPKEIERVFQAMKEILLQAVRLQGTSISDYRTPEGKKGGFSEIRKVYRKAGKECPRCQTTIQRLTVGQRSAHFCPQCQPFNDKT